MMPTATSDPADIAARHLNQGRVSAAQSIYDDMLARNPNDPRALGGLGAISLQGGDVNRAMEVFAQATRVAPRDPQAVLNLGVGYQASGKLDDAEACFRRAIALDGTIAAAHGNLASILAAKGDTGSATAELETAIGLAPDHADYRYNLANLMLARGDQRAAVEGYRTAIALDDDHIAARNNLALVLKQSGQLDAAARELTEARMREPGNAEIQANLADVLSQLGRHEEAMALARNALSLAPNNGLLRSSLGVVLMNAGRLDEALTELASAVRSVPKDPTPPLHMATLLRRQGRLEAALTAAARSVALAETPGPADLIQGELLLALGRADDAWPSFDRVAETTPVLGRIGAPLDPAALPGATLRVLALEPSSLFFAARLFAPLAAAGVEVEVVCPPLLERLAGCISGVACVSARQSIDLEALAAEDTPLCTATDLPRLMRAEPPEDKTPAIALPDDAVTAMAERLTGSDRPLIGLWWEGDGMILDPAPLVEAVAGTPIILQTGAPRQALGTTERTTVDLGDGIADFLDLAVAMSGLDGVVVVDGPVAHLAAALGLRVWVLAGIDQPWPWSGPDDRSIWYPGSHVLRQTPDRSWQSAVARLAELTGMHAP